MFAVTELQAQVEALIADEDVRFSEIEAFIERQAVDEDSKSALWLLAFYERRDDRRFAVHEVVRAGVGA